MEAKDMIPVGTKVSPEARKIMKGICARKGFSEYDMLQMFIDVAIRMTDEAHNLSYELEQLMQLFDGMKDWRTSIRLTDPINRMLISEAFYVLTEKGRTGTRLVHVAGDPSDMYRTETFNVQEIVERFFCLCLPNIYKRMRLLSADIGTSSVYETLMRIADDYVTNPDHDELRLMFSDDDWQNGRKMSDQQKTKQTRPGTQRRLFDLD